MCKRMRDFARKHEIKNYFVYRFFKLSVRRHEFRDIFKEKLDLHHIPALSNVLYSEDILFPIADFYLKKERWNEAIEVYP